MKIPNLTYHTYSLIDAPKIHTDLLWDFTILFVGLGTIYFISIFVIRNRITKKSKRVAEKKMELSPKISEFLFHEEDDPVSDKANYINLKIEVREFIKNPANRKILSEVLLDLRKDVSGDTLKRLCKLYRDFELHNDAYKKLKSWRWERVAKGILELTQMQVLESYGFIIKYINDKRSAVRKQAEIAAVSLKPEGINHFLDTTKYKITEWQQLKLLDVIRNKEDFQPPKFRAWLTSNNKHVVLFALRLIKYYKQNDANSSIIELVKHKNNNIKEEAIECIKEFFVTEALEVLKNVFWKSTVGIKLSILDALAQIGTEKEIPFFRKVEQKESNFTVKSKALSAINVIAPDTVMPTENIEEIVVEASMENQEIKSGPINTDSGIDIPTEIAQGVDLEEDGNTPNILDVDVVEDNISVSAIESVKMDIDPTDILDEISFEPIFEETDSDKNEEKLEPKENEGESLEFELPQFKTENQIEEYMKESIPDTSESLNLEKIINETLNNQHVGVDLPREGDVQYTDNIPETIVSEDENEEIFDVCFMQELEDILSSLNTIIEDDSKGVLPLDFLPIVQENPNKKMDTKPDDEVEIDEQAVKDELEGILQKIKNDDIVEDECEIDLRFLPLVTNEEVEQSKTENIDETTHEQSNPPIENENAESDNPNQKIMAQKPDVGFKGFSIFEELFRTCDAESKLILLDEVLAVGDQKEIEFLETLLNDSDKRIRTKAESTRRKLLEHLSEDGKDVNTLETIGMNPEEGFSGTFANEESLETPILDINFHLDPELEEIKQKRRYRKSSSGFLDQIIPSFIKDRLNG